MGTGLDEGSDSTDLELSPIAEEVYSGYLARAKKAIKRGDVHNAHITSLNMIRDAFRLILASPQERKYALAGRLSGIYRISKGRMRICWLVAPGSGQVCILFISDTPRKEGDKNDPYAVFTKMMMSGQYHSLLEGLGVELPDGKAAKYRVQ